MPFSKMTLEELQQERIKLLHQRSMRLRGSNPYKRLSLKISQAERYISTILKQRRQQADAALKTKIRSMVNGQDNMPSL